MKKEEARAYNKRYHEAHREDILSRHRIYYKAHREQASAYAMAWSKAHPKETRVTQKRYRLAHLEQERARKKAKYKENPERIYERNLKNKYNLSLDAFNAMRLFQGNACAICKEPFAKTPHVDHDHETGNIRGLLCPMCNSGIGYFKDDPLRLRVAIEYLEKKEKRNNVG